MEILSRQQDIIDDFGKEEEGEIGPAQEALVRYRAGSGGKQRT